MKNKYFLNPCETEKELSDVFKLRYVAYRNVDAIDDNENEKFKDKYDLLQNSKTCAIYEDGGLVASIRACVYSPEHNFMDIPAFEVYKEDIEREVGLDKLIIESNRFVIDPKKADSKDLFKAPFSFIMLNALKFKADYILTAVRAKHAPLYKRILGMEPISTAKQYPGINVEMIMLAGNCSTWVPIIMERDETFRFTDEEIENYSFSPSIELTAGV